MAFTIANTFLGYPKIAATSATPWTGGNSTYQLPPLGTIVQANDPTYGMGEFIFLKGLDATAVGSWVTYNLDDWSTTLLVADAIGPVGIAMSANLTGSYGWYQISGKARGLALAAFADNNSVYATSTAGSVDDTAVAGDLVHRAKGASTIVGAGLAEFEISRPHVDDNIDDLDVS